MRNRQWRLVRPVRRAVQWAVILTFCVLPWLNLHEWTGIYGSLFALDIYGLPFSDPCSVFWPMAHGELPTRLWLGFGSTLVLALLLGRFFCGWLCPYGLLSEYAHLGNQKIKILLVKIGQAAQEKDSGADLSDVHSGALPLPGDAVHSAAFPAGPLPDVVAEILPPAEEQGDSSAPFWVRALVLALGIGLGVFWGTPLLQWLSMPGTLSLLPLYGWYGGNMGLVVILVTLILPLGILVLEFMTGLRLWCKWMCPQAVLLSVAAKLGQPFVHVRWDEQACKCPANYRPCASACSLRLCSRQQGGPNRGECVQCAACVAACHAKGAGALRMGLPAAKK